jgi:hypothetical protein
MIDKNILLFSLNKCIEFVEGNQSYQNTLIKWKNNLLDLNNDELNNLFIENCINESMKKINQEDSLDEEILVPSSKDKVYDDYEKTKEIKKDKDKKILDKKELDEALQNDKIIGFFILESIIDKDKHKYLLDRYVLENKISNIDILNEEEIEKINSIWDMFGAAWSGVKGLTNTMINSINKGNQNIKEANENFKNMANKFKTSLLDVKNNNSKYSEIQLDDNTAKEVENMLLNKIDNLDDESKQIFLANLNSIVSKYPDFKDTISSYLIDSTINSKNLDFNFKEDINIELLNSKNRDIFGRYGKHVVNNELDKIIINVPTNLGNDITKVEITQDEYNMLYQIVNNQKGFLGGFGLFNWRSEANISEIMDKINQNSEHTVNKDELIDLFTKLSYKTKEDISLNKDDFNEAINNLVNSLSSDQTELVKNKNSEFFNYVENEGNSPDIIETLTDTNENMDTVKHMAVMTIIGVSVSIIILIVSILVTKYVKKTRYVQKNCRPGDKECLYNVKLMEFDKTLEILNDIRKNAKLTIKQKKVFDKKIKKLEQLKDKLKQRKNKLLQKDKYIKMVAMNKSIRRF